MLRFSANLSMLFREFSFIDRFSAARRAGFTGVEFLFPYQYEASQLADLLNMENLELALFNFPPGDWKSGERGIAALPDRRADFLESLEKALKYADTLKCPTLHVMAGILGKETSVGEAIEVYVENLRLACDAAKKKDITIVIEPLNTRDVPGYLLSSTTEACKVIKAVSRKNIGLQFDLYHCQIMEGDLETKILSLSNIINHIQIAGVPNRNEPDTGEVNYSHLFKIINETCYDGWIGCEYNPRGLTNDGLGWLKALKK